MLSRTRTVRRAGVAVLTVLPILAWASGHAATQADESMRSVPPVPSVDGPIIPPIAPWVPPVLEDIGPVGTLGTASVLNIQSETTVALTGATEVNGQNDFRGPSSFSGVLRSTNSGASFTDVGPLPAAANTTVNGDPCVAVWEPTMGSPIFYYTSLFRNASGQSTLCLHKSTDLGLTWTGPTEITAATISSADKEWLTVDKETGRVIVTWTDFGGTTTIRRTYSDDQGVTWVPSITLFTGNAQGSVVAADPNGPNVYAAFLFTSGSNSQVGISRSLDNGVTFSTTLLNPTFKAIVPPYGFDRNNSFPSLAVNPSDGGVELVYAASLNKTPSNDFGDIFYRRSTNGGVTWSAAVQVNVEDGLTGRPQVFPTVTAASDGRIDIFWYDESAGTGVDDWTDLYWSWSNNLGTSFSSPVPVTASAFHNEIGNNYSAPHQGDYIDAASSGVNSAATFAWTGNPSPAGTFPEALTVTVSSATQYTPLRVRPATVLITDTGCGVNDGMLVANEDGTLTIPVENIGRSTLTGINGTLSSLTTGVTVTSSGSTYADLASGASGNPTTPFQIHLDPTFPCGDSIVLQLTLSATGTASIFQTVVLPSGVTTNSTVLLSENFDGVTPPALPVNWSAVNGCATCVANDWTTTNTMSLSAPNAAFVADATFTSFGRLFGPVVAVPATAQYVDVEFDAKWDLEAQDARTAFDGFSWEYQLDGVGGSRFATSDAVEFVNRYTHYVVRSSGGTSGDRSGWSGNNGAFQHVRVRIVGLAGHTMIPRWSLTTDSNTGLSGLWVDNVVITAREVGCGSCTPTAVVENPRDTGAGSGTGLSLRISGPQPSRGATALLYTLTEPSTVRIDVYNLAGQKVRTLANGFAAAGDHVAYVNAGAGERLAAGMYLARLTAGAATRTVRIMLSE